MAAESLVEQLLEEISDSGRTPEEVCGAYPELLPEVRRRWRQMRAVEAELDALFPGPGHGPDADTDPSGHAGGDLPRIPGYEVEVLLGRGGMGVVYKARHLRLNRPVALKMLLAGAYAGPHERARFQREAEAVAGLRHPNIVQVYDVGDHEGWPYFTMEFVEGGNLAQKVAGTPQPARQAAALLMTLAEAVQAAHQGGVLHRDLKPANILLSAGGTPKVTDFGLARRLDRGAGLTLSGTPMGTPSYMAPEQVQGPRDAIGPPTDVYALGAILYDLLTGRPPFRSDTATTTLQQVVSEEPAPPSRLNARVPRDLETICLKCLRKEPQRRYATAAALADDLGRFLRDEPIAARPVGLLERGLRWVWRRRAGAGLMAGALALVGLAVGGALWVRWERAASGPAVEQRDPLEQARRDQEFGARLDAIHLRRVALLVGSFDMRSHKTLADQEYEAAFREAGLGRVHEDPKVVGARVQASKVRAALLAALDDWAVCAAEASDQRRLAWLLEVAQRADRDPTGSRNRLRDPAAWSNQEALAERIETALAARPPVHLLVALGERFGDTGGNAIPFLTRVQQAYPGDFWANLTLGDALSVRDPGEAIRYYQTARTIRPGAAVAYHNLGIALAASSRLDEAIDQQRQALRIDAGYGVAHYHIGISLRAKGRVDEAIDHFRKALDIDPGFGPAHYNFGLALRTKGRVHEAIDHFRQALRISPRDVDTHYNLGLALKELGRVDDAIDHYNQALQINPGHVHAHYNLALALIDAGRVDDAIDHLRQTVAIDPNHAAAHTHLGLALQGRGHLDAAILEFDHALRIDGTDAYAHNGLGLALVEKRRLNEAIAHYEKAIDLNPLFGPAHINCALALKAQGQRDEAIKHLQQALRINPGDGLAHCDLGLVLTDAGRMEEAIDHFRQAVRLDPSMTVAQTGLGTGLYAAARAAVGAAAGQGAEKVRLGEPERAAKRRQALDWLRANLELRADVQNDGKVVGWSLTTWQTDPALASVRDPAALAKLPDVEREQWQRLWADVAALVAADPVEQGRAGAARRDWAQAADCYARALKRGPTDDGHFWFEYAALLLLSGDRPGYTRACAHLVGRCGKATDLRAGHVARACTLAPDAVADAALPGRLAEKELRASPQQFWSLTRQGALAYRAGRYQEAVPLFEQSLEADPKPGRAVVNWLWLALTHQRLGKVEEARRWLGKAQAWLDQHRDGMPARAEEELGLHLHNWLEAHVLRREAESLIEPGSPRISTGNRERGAPQK